jgi:hypothetical protein
MISSSQVVRGEVGVGEIDLWTHSSTKYVGEDFFFNVHLNLTMSNLIDESGYQNEVIVNGPNMVTNYNQVGLLFDKTYDNVIVNNSKYLNPQNQLTIEIWAQFSSFGKDTPGHDWFTLICKGNSWDTASYCLLLSALSNNRGIYFMLNGTKAVTANAHIENNAWFQIVATYDGSYADLYLNGKLLMNSPYEGNLSSNDNDLWIGSEKGDVYPFRGLIQSTRIYDKALSQDEIRASFQNASIFQNEALVLNLDSANLSYVLEKSYDGNSFHQVAEYRVGQTFFSWKENQIGTTYYRIAIPEIKNGSEVFYSPTYPLNVVARNPQVFSSLFVYTLVSVMIFIVAIGLTKQLKNKESYNHHVA